jgi:heterodisulfide reductase subunit C
MSRVISLLNLAYRFNMHLLKKPFVADRDHEARFLRHYRDDRLVPLDPQHSLRLPELSRCIGCGLCNGACPRLQASTRHLFNGPADLPGCLSRGLTDAHLLRSYLDLWQQCGDCRDCEHLCPADVPLRELAVLMTALMEQLESSLAAGDGVKDPG